MGKRGRYEPGTFCWTDLATTNPEDAKAFYSELFGWTYEDLPAGENFTYTMAQLDGDTVCGLYQKGDEHHSQSFPPYWLSYISVEGAGETAAKAKGLGGTVIEEAYGDDWGRMTTVQDPAGATFAAWQPKDHIGASRVNDPGCLCLNELNTSDPERAVEFYEGLFGWDVKQVSEDPPYWGMDNKGWLNGGMMPAPEGVPSHWLVYFTTENLDESVSKIETLGGTVMLPRTDIPPDERIAVFTDPQGATFALFEGRTDE